MQKGKEHVGDGDGDGDAGEAASSAAKPRKAFNRTQTFRCVNVNIYIFGGDYGFQLVGVKCQSNISSLGIRLVWFYSYEIWS